MKRFLFQFALFIIISFILLELTLRIFQFAGNTVPQVNLNGNKLRKPNVTGEWIRGGMGEIRSTYHFNNKGWNSTVDYSDAMADSLKIALIGDSYVQGFHTSVDSSIGRQFEYLYRSSKIVYEYGQAGGNIVDFSKIYEAYHLEDYFKVFILITDKDLTKKKASFMGKGKSIPKQDFMRKLYGFSHLIRYFNINHGFLEGIKNIPSKPFRNLSADEEKPINIEKVNNSAINSFGKNVVFLYEEGRLSPEVRNTMSFPLQLIKPIYLPDDCGFDGHWNINGRKNCALAMKAYLDSL